MHTRSHDRPDRDGFSVVELMVGITLLVIAVGGMAVTIVSGNRLEASNEETTQAYEAARRKMEELRSADPTDVFAAYNSDPADDPAGAPGSGFAVAGLNVRAGDPDGLQGRVVLPETPTGVGAGVELREDLADASFGMPRDLNGDGVVDAVDHAGDYTILPVRVLVEWTGRSGDRTISLDTILGVR